MRAKAKINLDCIDEDGNRVFYTEGQTYDISKKVHEDQMDNFEIPGMILEDEETGEKTNLTATDLKKMRRGDLEDHAEKIGLKEPSGFRNKKLLIKAMRDYLGI